MTEYASLSKYLSKNVQVVIQVVNNKKVMAKTPREANLHGNWCVRKGLKGRRSVWARCTAFGACFLWFGQCCLNKFDHCFNKVSNIFTIIIIHSIEIHFLRDHITFVFKRSPFNLAPSPSTHLYNEPCTGTFMPVHIHVCTALHACAGTQPHRDMRVMQCKGSASCSKLISCLLTSLGAAFKIQLSLFHLGNFIYKHSLLCEKTTDNKIKSVIKILIDVKTLRQDPP